MAQQTAIVPNPPDGESQDHLLKKIPNEMTKLSELRNLEKAMSTTSEVFDDVKQPSLADYL